MVKNTLNLQLLRYFQFCHDAFSTPKTFYLISNKKGGSAKKDEKKAKKEEKKPAQQPAPKKEAKKEKPKEEEDDFDVSESVCSMYLEIK